MKGSDLIIGGTERVGSFGMTKHYILVSGMMIDRQEKED